MLFSVDIIGTQLDANTILHWVNTGGVVALLILILLGGSRKFWVFGWQYRDLEKRYEKVEESNLMWMQLALRGVNLSEQAVKTVVMGDDSKKV